MLHIIMHKIS